MEPPAPSKGGHRGHRWPRLRESLRTESELTDTLRQFTPKRGFRIRIRIHRHRSSSESPVSPVAERTHRLIRRPHRGASTRAVPRSHHRSTRRLFRRQSAVSPSPAR
ncbi:hypothetical protein F750_1719 [Streptomyces sp. PAMC 26508]|nr:hypothetical protein F750_1719 [Streptomyces sp. PAMC 26508]